jgi:hypothetical protein
MFDGSKEQCGPNTEFMTNVRRYSINFHITEPYRPNHNFTEGVIREVRKKSFRIMVRRNVPQRLWDYGLQWVCDIQNRTSNSSRGLDGRCPLERVTGETVDISEYLDFGISIGSGTARMRDLERPSSDVGSECHIVLAL